MRPIAAARRVLAAAAVALTVAVGIGAGAPGAGAGIRDACTWQPLTPINGWQSEQNDFRTGDPAFCAESDGMVYLSGSVGAPNGFLSKEFAVLPAYAAPAHRVYLNTYTMDGAAGVVRVDPDGSLHAFSGNYKEFTSLAGLSFPAAGVPAQGLMPLLNGWQSSQSLDNTGNPAYFISRGAVHLSGEVYRPAGKPLPFSPDWVFAMLPAPATPTGCFETAAYTINGPAATDIDPSGNMYGADPTSTSLTGISYPAGPAAWHPLTLMNTAGTCDVPSYAVTSGVVYFTATLEFNPGFHGEFAILPPVARPAHTLYLVVYGDGPGSVRYASVRIDPDGAMSVFGLGGQPWGDIIMLAGVSYHTGS
jgi:hypothetical protein